MDPLLDHRLTPGARVLLGWIVRHHTGDWSADGAVYLTGPAATVFTGEIACCGGAR